MFQIIAADGTCDETLDPNLPPSELRRLYRLMLLLRTLDIKALNLQRQGRISLHAPCIGQEASQLGSAYALQSQDWVVSSYREVGIPLLRGVPTVEIFHQLFGNSKDRCAKGRQMPCHWAFREINFVSISTPVGTQIPNAVGIAMAVKIRGDKSIAITYFGDGGTSTASFHSGMNFAGVFKAPVVFFCQNNQWAISLPVQRQTAAATLATKATAYGFPGIRVDGNDILAVYAVTKEAIERARALEGPTLIEAYTYRLGPHTTADDPTRYRSGAEVDEWRKKDPLVRYHLYLMKRGLLDDQEEERARQEAEEEVNLAVEEAERTPPPPLETLFEDVYQEIPPHLLEQRDYLLSLTAQEVA